MDVDTAGRAVGVGWGWSGGGGIPVVGGAAVGGGGGRMVAGTGCRVGGCTVPGGAGGGGMTVDTGWRAFAAAEKCGMRGGGPGRVVPGLPAGAAGLTVRRIGTSSCAMNDHESDIQN